MPPDVDALLRETLSDFETRRARGESPSVNEYRDRLGPVFPVFLDLVASGVAGDAPPVPTTAGLLPRAFGPYTLQKILGRGGHGVVYQAFHERLGRQEAVKMLFDGSASDPDKLARFRREALAAGRLTHPHILPIHGAGEVDGIPYLAMALVHGRTLADAVRGGPASDPRTWFARLAPVADALHALHEVGVVHRDVKPANLLVGADERILLADFGLARAPGVSTLTASDQMLGSLHYMAPEQARAAREVGPAADVYALGATIYALLTGAPPFAGAGIGDVVPRLLDERPSPPSIQNPQVGEDADRVVLMCLEKRPEDRYPDVRALADDLRALAQGRAVSGRPVGPARRAARWTRRRALPLLAGTAALAGLGVWHFSRDATFELNAYVRADFYINGEFQGQTLADEPTPVRFATGRVEIRLEHGFLELENPIVRLLTPGRNAPVPVFWKAGPTEAFRAARILRRIGHFRAHFDQVRAQRGFPDERILPLFPRGAVRRADLAFGLVSYPFSYQAKRGTELVFEVQGGATIRMDAGTQHSLARVRLGAELVDQLAVGDRVRWYRWPDQSTPSPLPPARFEVVADERLTSTAQQGLLDVQPHWAWLYLKSAIWHHAGLHTAALSAAHATQPLDARKRGDSLVPWLVAHRALGALALEDSAVYENVVARIADFPEAVVASWTERG